MDRKITVNWKAKAKKVIKERYAQALNDIGMDTRKIERYITAGYESYAGTPKRKKYPYRAWRHELNKVIETHKLKENQLFLFDVTAYA
jgi:hypothetical protein